MFKIGLVVNPVAGLGGSVALKGSDGADIVEEAKRRGAVASAGDRAAQALKMLDVAVELYTYPGAMGEKVAQACAIDAKVVGHIGDNTSAEDTERAAQELTGIGIDLLLFVGGDGTARNIFNAIGTRQVALGIPAGVKMHSGVYALSPQRAGELVNKMLHGEMVSVALAEVRDIDEQAFRAGKVLAKYYGELKVPQDINYVQQVKCGGLEVEDLVLQEIAAQLREDWQPGRVYIVGSGSTTQKVMAELGYDTTLLGVDVIKDGEILVRDATEQQILSAITEGEAKIILTAIGGQGHILGRGNQQLSAEVIRRVGKENLLVIATKAKLESLDNKPLWVDTGSPSLDAELAGHLEILCGYEDYVYYPVGLTED